MFCGCPVEIIYLMVRYGGVEGKRGLTLGVMTTFLFLFFSSSSSFCLSGDGEEGWGWGCGCGVCVCVWGGGEWGEVIAKCLLRPTRFCYY